MHRTVLLKKNYAASNVNGVEVEKPECLTKEMERFQPADSVKSAFFPTFLVLEILLAGRVSSAVLAGHRSFLTVQKAFPSPCATWARPCMGRRKLGFLQEAAVGRAWRKTVKIGRP